MDDVQARANGNASTSAMRSLPSIAISRRSTPSATPAQAGKPCLQRRQQALVERRRGAPRAARDVAGRARSARAARRHRRVRDSRWPVPAGPGTARSARRPAASPGADARQRALRGRVVVHGQQLVAARMPAAGDASSAGRASRRASGPSGSMSTSPSARAQLASSRGERIDAAAARGTGRGKLMRRTRRARGRPAPARRCTSVAVSSIRRWWSQPTRYHSSIVNSGLWRPPASPSRNTRPSS